MEALVLISNQFKDFEKQKAFLNELMASMLAEWTSDEMRRLLSIPDCSCCFILAPRQITDLSSGFSQSAE